MIAYFIRRNHFDDELQIVDQLPDGRTKLVRVNNPRKMPASGVPSRCKHEKIFILSKDNPAQVGCALEQLVVWRMIVAIILRYKNIHTSPTQAGSHRVRDVMIDIKRQAHD